VGCFNHEAEQFAIANRCHLVAAFEAPDFLFPTDISSTTAPP